MTPLLRLLCACAVLGAPAATLGAEPAPPLLHPMFQDHAVLQRDREVPVWGEAPAGQLVTVTLAGHTASAQAGPSGRWSVTLPALPAGGPHSLVAQAAAGARQAASDVLIGDVWLCAGQSNMALPVSRTLDARAEISTAARDSVRMLTVGQATSVRPLAVFPSRVEWQVASPATVPDWSATCFYFARELQKSVPVPMGLVNASWGGANIRAFLSEAALRATGRHDEGLELLQLYGSDPGAATRRFGALWEDWWRGRPGEPGVEPWSTTGVDDRAWPTAPPALGPWEGWGVPELAAFNGMVWYRTTARLTAGQAAQAATLSLGPVDEIDQTWVNGTPVGATSGPGTDRLYPLPPGALHAGDNLIVVNALDTYGSGGLYGPPEKRALRLADGSRVPLAGPWRYQAVPAGLGRPPRLPWEATGGLGTLYNGMVAPIGPYGLRGAVWYQGESNTEEAEHYQGLLAGLMADWRGHFGADLPFLIVQLAGYGARPVAPVESGTARLRDAQRLAVAADRRAGLAVAIDLGDPQDIHPANKQEVGRRLARAARHVVYAEAISPSGPVPLGARRDPASGRIVVAFGGVEGRLVAYSADEPVGFELCGPDRGSCRFARATIQGTRVWITPSGGPAPARVRFCWADSPVCTLYDEAGLPAGPFELQVQE
jgi:sialate O-acetylesterase